MLPRLQIKYNAGAANGTDFVPACTAQLIALHQYHFPSLLLWTFSSAFFQLYRDIESFRASLFQIAYRVGPYRTTNGGVLCFVAFSRLVVQPISSTGPFSSFESHCKSHTLQQQFNIYALVSPSYSPPRRGSSFPKFLMKPGYAQHHQFTVSHPGDHIPLE